MLNHEEKTVQQEGSVIVGIGLGLGLNAILLYLGAMAVVANENVQWRAMIFYWPVAGISLTQLLYIIPLYRRFRKTGRNDTAKGLVIAASLTTLLNATCWGIMILK